MNKQLSTVKNKLLLLDGVLTGTILKAYKPCGKNSCRCARKQKYWHGPYYVWTRKENGKTITKTLSAQQVRFCNKAFKHMKLLNQYIKKWKTISLEQLNRLK